TAVGNEWCGNKCAGVEEPIDTAADAAVQNCILQRLPRRQAPRGEISRRPEQRACGAVKDTEGEPGLKRNDSRDCPAPGQFAERESVPARRLRQLPGVADHGPVLAIEVAEPSLRLHIVLIVEYLFAENRRTVNAKSGRTETV